MAGSIGEVDWRDPSAPADSMAQLEVGLSSLTLRAIRPESLTYTFRYLRLHLVVAALCQTESVSKAIVVSAGRPGTILEFDTRQGIIGNHAGLQFPGCVQ